MRAVPTDHQSERQPISFSLVRQGENRLCVPVCACLYVRRLRGPHISRLGLAWSRLSGVMTPITGCLEQAVLFRWRIAARGFLIWRSACDTRSLAKKMVGRSRPAVKQ